MDDLHVNNELTTTIVQDEDADTAVAGVEGLGKALPQVGLINDGYTGLDVTSLGHGDDGTILDVENTVLLEDGAKHGLDNNAGSRVGDERRLFVELLGEEVDTKVTVLASSRRGRDADDLAGTTLEDQDVTHADMVAGNGNSVRDGRSSVRLGAGGARDVGTLALGVEDTVSHLV